MGGRRVGLRVAVGGTGVSVSVGSSVSVGTGVSVSVGAVVKVGRTATRVFVGSGVALPSNSWAVRQANKKSVIEKIMKNKILVSDLVSVGLIE